MSCQKALSRTEKKASCPREEIKKGCMYLLSFETDRKPRVLYSLLFTDPSFHCSSYCVFSILLISSSPPSFSSSGTTQHFYDVPSCDLFLFLMQLVRTLNNFHCICMYSFSPETRSTSRREA